MGLNWGILLIGRNSSASLCGMHACIDLLQSQDQKVDIFKADYYNKITQICAMDGNK